MIHWLLLYVTEKKKKPTAAFCKYDFLGTFAIIYQILQQNKIQVYYNAEKSKDVGRKKKKKKR